MFVFLLHTGMPIIVATSNAVKSDRERCIDSGMDDYVSKPINTAKLAASIGYFADAE